MLPGLNPPPPRSPCKSCKLCKLLMVMLMLCLLLYLDLLIFSATFINGARVGNYASYLLFLWCFVFFGNFYSFIFMLVLILRWNFDVEKNNFYLEMGILEKSENFGNKKRTEINLRITFWQRSFLKKKKGHIKTKISRSKIP